MGMGEPIQRVLVVSHTLPYACIAEASLLESRVASSTSQVPSLERRNTMSATTRHRRHASFRSNLAAASTANSLRTSVTENTGALRIATVPANAQIELEERWKFVERPSHAALLFETTSTEVIYIGSPGPIFFDSEDLRAVDKPSPSTEQSLTEAFWKKCRCIPVFIPTALSKGHLEGFCKSNLWPLFHSLLWERNIDSSSDSSYWSDYIKANQMFADAIMKVYRPGDHIWVVNYHLLLVPSMIRLLNDTAKIGLFLRAPFPSSEIFRCLPQAKEVLSGMLGANVIAFQAHAYARHFISSCTRVLGLESSQKRIDFCGFVVEISVIPIGINVKKIAECSKEAAVAAKMMSMREMFEDKKIIIGIDRADQIRGVHHKLVGMQKFLKNYPMWGNKIVLIQIILPDFEADRRTEIKVAQLASQLNGDHGSLGFTPIHIYSQPLEPTEYLALLSIADVCLITSERDGISTTALDYVICQRGRFGSVILSEFTGTSGSMGAAFLVNPWDPVGIAATLNEVLSISEEERRTRHEELFRYAQNNSINELSPWFTHELNASSHATAVFSTTPYLDCLKMLEAFAISQSRLILLDYDGTLTPIRNTPNAAIPSSELLSTLALLASDPRNHVYVISGRDQKTLDDWLGKIGRIGLSAEHGCFLKDLDESGTVLQWTSMLDDISITWKDEVVRVFEYYTERTPGSFIEYKTASITWHYRQADPEFGSWQANQCQLHLENSIVSKLPVEVLTGKKNLEVRPASINKGEMVARLLSRYAEADFVFCAGDDKTDEDMFRILNRPATPLNSPINNAHFEMDVLKSSPKALEQPKLQIFTCTIGSANKKTLACYHVNTPAQVIEALTQMTRASLQTVNPASIASIGEIAILATAPNHLPQQ